MLRSPAKALFLPCSNSGCRCICSTAPQKAPKYTRSGEKIPSRLGARFKPYGVTANEPLPLTAEQKDKIEADRTLRAERQERMDITAALSPVKTFMGGFTVPKKLRTLDRMDTHFYTKRPRPERKPPADAYMPHCVFGFISQHPVWRGQGIATSRVLETGMCAEKDFKQVLAHYNGAAVMPGTSAYDETDEQNEDEIEEDVDNSLEEEEEQSSTILRTGLEERKLKMSNLTRKRKKLERAKVPLTYVPASKSLPPMAKVARVAAMNAIWGDRDWILHRSKLGQEASDQHKAYLASLPPDTAPPPEYQPPPVPDRPSGPFPVWTDTSAHLPLAVPLPPYTNPPFFTPLFVFTFPTRPLASSIKRLQAGLPRGLPYYASVPDADRKDGPSFFRRALRLRIDRLQSLIRHMARKLAGEEGGFVGIRFHQEDKGRLLNEERMQGIELEKRRIEVRWGEEALQIFGHGRGWEGVAEGWESIPDLYWGKVDAFGNPIGDCGEVPGAKERENFLGSLEEQDASFARAVEASNVLEGDEEPWPHSVDRRPPYTSNGMRRTQSGVHWAVRRTAALRFRQAVETNQADSWTEALKTLRAPTQWTGKPLDRADDPHWAWSEDIKL